MRTISIHSIPHCSGLSIENRKYFTSFRCIIFPAFGHTAFVNLKGGNHYAEPRKQVDPLHRQAVRQPFVRRGLLQSGLDHRRHPRIQPDGRAVHRLPRLPQGLSRSRLNGRDRPFRPIFCVKQSRASAGATRPGSARGCFFFDQKCAKRRLPRGRRLSFCLFGLSWTELVHAALAIFAII